MQSGEELRGILGDPWVMFEAGRYRMWFTYVLRPFTDNRIMGTAYAESADGLKWQIHRDSKTEEVKLVLEPTRDGWDAKGVETVSVVKTPGGTYMLYYTGDMPPHDHRYAIGLATSKDGVHWKKHGDGPVFAPKHDWEKPFGDGLGDGAPRIGGTLEPSVLYDADEKRFKMWYAALGMKDGVVGYRIGFATSKDGRVWERESEPVFEPGVSGRWDDAVVSHTHVVQDAYGGYHLLYHGHAKTDFEKTEAEGGATFTPGAIGHAYSADGISWVRNPKNPVLACRKDAWDSWFIGGPSALFRDDRFYLWYFGNDSPKTWYSRIGLAVADAVKLPKE
jgi:predicted GH43/DUF377 family glycosyl hydrolase